MYKIVFHRYKLVLLLFLNLFIVTSVYGKKIIIGKERVGEIKIGMPSKKVKKIVGEKKCEFTKTYKLTKIFKCKYGTAKLELLFYRPSWFYYFSPNDPHATYLPFYKNDMTLANIEIQDPFYKTEYGIGVGSEYSEVIKTYRRMKINFEETGLGGICVPSVGLHIAAKNKIEWDSIYKLEDDYKTYTMKKNKARTLFKDLPITSIIIMSATLGCELGD